VDAEPRREVRWAGRLSMCGGRPPPPEGDSAPDVRDAHLHEHAPLRRGSRHSHQLLPVPGGPLVAVHLRSEPHDGGPGLCAALCVAAASSCRNGLCSAGRDRASRTREQAGAGQDESPQNTTPTVDSSLASRRPSGLCPQPRGRHRAARLCRAYAHLRRHRHVKGL